MSKGEPVELVVAALSDWRAWLEELSLLFDELRGTYASFEPTEATERAAAQLLPLVVKRTSAEDAWHRTFQRVMTWYLEPLVEEQEATRLVEAAVGGHFESWVEPSGEVAEAVCASLGRDVAGVLTGRQAHLSDAVSDWLTTRARIRWQVGRVYTPPPVLQDGHLKYIEQAEHARDPERAQRMRQALTLGLPTPLKPIRSASDRPAMRSSPHHHRPAGVRSGPTTNCCARSCLTRKSSPKSWSHRAAAVVTPALGTSR